MRSTNDRHVKYQIDRRHFRIDCQRVMRVWRREGLDGDEGIDRATWFVLMLSIGMVGLQRFIVVGIVAAQLIVMTAIARATI